MYMDVQIQWRNYNERVNALDKTLCLGHCVVIAWKEIFSYQEVLLTYHCSVFAGFFFFPSIFAICICTASQLLHSVGASAWLTVHSNTLAIPSIGREGPCLVVNLSG